MSVNGLKGPWSRAAPATIDCAISTGECVYRRPCLLSCWYRRPPCTGRWPQRRLSHPLIALIDRVSSEMQNSLARAGFSASGSRLDGRGDATLDRVNESFSGRRVCVSCCPHGDVLFHFSLFSLLQMAVDVLEGLLEEDDEVVQVRNKDLFFLYS